MAMTQQASSTTKEARSRKLLSVVMAIVMAATLMIPHAAWAEEGAAAFGGQTQDAAGPVYYDGDTNKLGSSDKPYFFANGTPITISDRTDGQEGSLISWEGGSANVSPATNVFGGSHDNDAAMTTSITMTGGTVNSVFGGGMHKSHVTEARVALESGVVTSQVAGGGASSFDKNCGCENAAWYNGNAADSPCVVDKTAVSVNGAQVKQLLYGGGEGISCTKAAEVTIEDGTFVGCWVTAGGSNGYTGSAKLTIKGGTFDVVQGVNRGSVDSIEMSVSGATIKSFYIGGETPDKNVTGTYKTAAASFGDLSIEGLYPGSNGVSGTDDASKIDSVRVYESASIGNFDDAKAAFGEKMTTSIAVVGDKEYTNLAEAGEAAASSGNPLTLLGDCTTGPVSFAGKVTLDLAGNTLSIAGSDSKTPYGLQFCGAGANVLKNGTVIDTRSDGNQEAGWRAVHVSGTADLATENVKIETFKPDTPQNYNYLIRVGDAGDVGAKHLTLGAGTELSNLDNSSNTSSVSYGAVGIALFGTTNDAASISSKVKLDVAEGASIKTMGYAIAGNGESHGTEIAIDGGSLVSTDSAAIYHPQAGTLVLNGGTLEGTTGIQLCSGAGTIKTEFQFNGGTVRGFGQDERATKTGDGLVSDGSAISLVNRNYPGGVPSISINGGKFSSASNDAVLAYTWKQGDGGKYSASEWSEAAEKISITGGYFSSDPSAFVAEGKAALPSSEAGYLYTVGDSKAPADTKPVVTEPDVVVSDDIPADKKEEVSKSVAGIEAEGLSGHANAVAQELSEAQVTQAKNELENAIEVGPSDTVTVYVQAYLSVEAKAITEDAATGAKALVLDITPMSRIVASTAESAENIELGEAGKNAVAVGEPQKIEVNTNTVISVPLPSGFVADADTAVYAKHAKDGVGTYIYTASLTKADDGTYTATFTNPHGFSEFTVTTANESAAQIGDTVFGSLQDAVNNVADGQTIKLMKSGENAAIGRAVSFTLDLNGYTAGKISAAEGFTLSVDGSVYTVAKASTPDVPAKATRLGGADRYKTMELVSKESFPVDGSCETVVIARGNEFPDALAASGLAGTLNAQVLITETDVLTAETKAEIKRLGAKKAIVLGNEYSVSARTFNEIKSLVGGNAERVCGDNRLETALEIYKAGKGWGKTAVVATSAKAADSLSISPVAYALNAPVFLAGEDGSVSKDVLDAIAKGGFDKVLVLGDKYSVSDDSLALIKKLVSDTERIGGTDRYITSQLTAKWAVEHADFSYAGVSLTAGRDGKYADALVSSSLGGKSASPLLLVDEGEVGSACISGALAPNKGAVKEAFVLGDKWTVSDALFSTIQKALA